jgi:excisionase family DNA binding protein
MRELTQIPPLDAYPSLDELARAPERAEALSEPTRSILVARCAAVLCALSASGLARFDQQPSENQAAQPERLLTVLEVAEMLSFARGYTYELVRRGEIRALHHGKHWRISLAAVKEFIAKYESERGVDKSVSLMLSRLDDRRTTQASTKGARTRTDRTREAARRPSHDSVEVGVRDLAHS